MNVQISTTIAYNWAKIARAPRDQFMNVFPWFGFLCHFFCSLDFFSEHYLYLRCGLHTWISLNLKATMLFEWLIMNCCMHCNRFRLCHYCVKFSACFLIASAIFFSWAHHSHFVCIGCVVRFFFLLVLLHFVVFSFVYNFKHRFCDA